MDAALSFGIVDNGLPLIVRLMKSEYISHTSKLHPFQYIVHAFRLALISVNVM